jgi:pyruvate/2-oxoacid:ferredoxin oxidoreductase alpha subunit
MADLTALAFELADKYRNPVFLLADGFIGQMMEPVEFPQIAVAPKVPDWAVAGTKESRGNLITSLHMDINELEQHLIKLQAKYAQAEREDVMSESYFADDAEIVLVGYGIMGRILKAVTVEAREMGLPVGLLRPITLFPFPKLEIARLAKKAKAFIVVEMSNGQMVEDVRLAVNGTRPVEFVNRMGGNVPTHEQVMEVINRLVSELNVNKICNAEEARLAHV